MYKDSVKIGSYELQVPFVTTASDKTKSIAELADFPAESIPTIRAVDLGSGDGRVVLELAKKGFLVTGFEIKEDLVLRSRQRIKDAKLEDRATIYQKSFWEADLSSFDLIYLYGMGSILGRLEKKLEKEVRPGTKVISNIFRFPTWKYKKEKDHLYLYIVS